MIQRFPGVDPYVESQHYWPDFHQTFVNYWREAIAEVLPAAYEARLDEYVTLNQPDAEQREVILPDIAVVHSGRSRSGSEAVSVLEPETIPTVMLDQERQSFIQILHRPDRSVVTILELLSPTNKTNPGRRDYLARRNAILWQSVHLVELDLLIGGERVPMKRALPNAHFHAIISRVDNRPLCDVYSWTLRDRLPAIPVPLRAPDPDISVDLAAVYATAFERGRYARSIDYTASPQQSLDPESLSFIQARAAGSE